MLLGCAPPLKYLSVALCLLFLFKNKDKIFETIYSIVFCRKIYIKFSEKKKKKGIFVQNRPALVACNLKKRLQLLRNMQTCKKSVTSLVTYRQVLSYGLHLFTSVDVILVGFPVGLHCQQGFPQHLEKSITRRETDKVFPRLASL